MTLFDECVLALGETTTALSKERSSQVIAQMKAKFPFTPWERIDWDIVSKKSTVTNSKRDYSISCESR